MLISKSVSVQHSVLRQINPLLKISLCCVGTSLALFLHEIGALSALVIPLLLGIALTVRLPWHRWVYPAIALLLFLLISTALRGFEISLVSTLRLLAILLPTPILASTTPPGDLVRALQTARLPGFLVLTLMLIWRFIPLIQQEAQRILEANQLRGIDLPRTPEYWFGGLIMPLIFRIVAYADEVTIGLETRGYDPSAPRSIGRPLKWRRIDTGFVIIFCLLLAIVCYLEWGR